jgi:hypothetical protein
MKEEKKSEFSSKMEEIAKQATALVEKDSKKSVIIIATESDDDDGMAATIAIAGHGKELEKPFRIMQPTMAERNCLFRH